MQSPSGFSWNALPEYARMWQNAVPEEPFITASSSLARLSGMNRSNRSSTVNWR